MVDLARTNKKASGLRRRALNQAARELLLSQASDWAFIMKMKTTASYAVQRTREHIYNFTRLHESITGETINQEWLSSLEQRNSIFPSIDYRVYSP
jgi:1,4-alpha-glucan branching enzyme